MESTEDIRTQPRVVDEQAYRYGLEMRDDPEYSGRSWTGVEDALSAEWQRRHAGRPWADLLESVRIPWDGITPRGSDEADRLRFDEEHVTAP